MLHAEQQKEQQPPALEPAAENGEGGLEADEAAEPVPFMLEAQPAASNVQEVGTSDPVGDFVSLIGRGRLDAAFRGMQAIITDLVDSSMGSRSAIRPPPPLDCHAAQSAMCQDAVGLHFVIT